MKHILPNNQHVFIERIQVPIVKKKLKNCSRLMKSKETQQLNAIANEHFAIKHITGTIGETRTRPEN